MIIKNFADLQVALRQRAEQLNVPRREIDELAGLPAGYASKLLGKKPVRRFGAMSFEVMLAALGLRLRLEEDPAAMERVHARLRPRISWSPHRQAIREARAARERAVPGEN
jgi:hypothetical protein